MEALQSIQDYKFVVFRGRTIRLAKDYRGFWVDDLSTIWAFAETSSMTDTRDVCGVGWFSLNENDPRNKLCKPHDYAYSSPVYQAFHTRAEADFMLYTLLKSGSDDDSITPDLFWFLSRELGGFFWENDSTNV